MGVMGLVRAAEDGRLCLKDGQLQFRVVDSVFGEHFEHLPNVGKQGWCFSLSIASRIANNNKFKFKFSFYAQTHEFLVTGR